MEPQEPKVSIVVPVYNAEPYLSQCLDSIARQSWSNLEVICVDDGSSDRSLGILAEYAEKDSRFILLEQQNRGAGVARNAGMARASGKYIIFLDSDDCFDQKLIEKSVGRAETYHADTVIFRAIIFDDKTNRKRNLNDCIHQYRQFEYRAFSVHDLPDAIFNSFLLAAWNKLYNLNFLKRNHLCFQDLKRSNDMFFTLTALAKAERIVLMDEVLLYYRKGMITNLQARNEKTPLEFYKALAALKAYLEKEQLYELTKASFVKLALETTFYNINSIAGREIKNKIVQFMNETGWSSLGIQGNKDVRESDGILCSMLKAAQSGRISLLKPLYLVFKAKQYLPHVIENIKWNITGH